MDEELERKRIMKYLDEHNVSYSKDLSLGQLYLLYVNTQSTYEISCVDSKHFGPAENSALQRIIDKYAVEPKDNFFDYYE